MKSSNKKHALSTKTCLLWGKCENKSIKNRTIHFNTSNANNIVLTKRENSKTQNVELTPIIINNIDDYNAKNIGIVAIKTSYNNNSTNNNSTKAEFQSNDLLKQKSNNEEDEI